MKDMRLNCSIVLIAVLWCVLASFTNGVGPEELEKEKGRKSSVSVSSVRRRRLLSRRNNDINTARDEEVLSFLSLSEKILSQKCGKKCQRRRKRSRIQNRKRESCDVICQRKRCLKGQGLDGKGRYEAGVWGTWRGVREVSWPVALV